MVELSIAVSNRIVSANYVSDSVTSHKCKIAELLKPFFQSMTEVDILQFLEAIGTSLTKQTEALRKAETEYVNERANAPAAQEQKELAFQDALKTLRKMRYRLLSLVGEETTQKYGIQAEETTDPLKLLSLLDNAATLLKSETEPFIDDFQEEGAPNRKIYPIVLGQILEEKAKRLEEALESENREERKLQAAMLRRDHSLSQWGNTYQSISTTLEGLYRLAGLKELADKIHPTLQRRRGESIPQLPADDPQLSSSESE